MQSSLKKSLYLGLAALSFVSVAAVSTTASAKSYAKAGAYTSLEKTDATTRNVEATGTNALYTKPGTVKGAKVVASKATMAKLAASKKSADYFRAYGQKTTDRGSVYYRVVTMDGKYRGYVYGGKSATAFAGGIKSANTTTEATLPTATKGYYLKDSKTNTLWTAPKYTQYKASKVSLYGAKASDTFTVSKAATKTREGSLYYYVTDDNNSSVAGWVYAKGLTTDAQTTFDETTQVQVLVKATDGTTLKTFSYNAGQTSKGAAVADTVLFDSATDPKNLSDGLEAAATKALTGTGYSVAKGDTVNMTANVKTGDTITLYATKGQEAITKVTAMRYDSNATSSKSTAFLTTTTPVAATAYYTVSMPSVTTAFSGTNGAAYTAADVEANVKANKAQTLSSGTIYLPAGTPADADATVLAGASLTNTDVANPTNTVAYHVVYTLKNGVAGTYGNADGAQALYTGTLVQGAAATTTPDAGNSWGNGAASVVAPS
ncbi:S-layer protein [Levilactobacillus lanxiensis]|uniref:S-layer protein n=1 Tax=Levilactobacillus lanxiensis TaxID=2799568 RepID=A0ABW4D2F1_9LACO|nr:S-layer protein [Levilactobacillus lanxiensis]